MSEERLRALLYKALRYIEHDNSDYFVSSVGNEYEWFEENIGITRSEMNELGIDWLNDGSYEDDDDNN